jgi:N utilization substance protein B
MLYFESIPLKVSINEYIDIAKSYSTPQSGQFVNGLLDNVRKQLSDQNKLTKTDYVKKK